MLMIACLDLWFSFWYDCVWLVGVYYLVVFDVWFVTGFGVCDFGFWWVFVG